MLDNNKKGAVNSWVKLHINAVVDDKGNTPLHLAVKAENTAIVQLLMQNGANTEAIANLQGNTPSTMLLEKISALMTKLGKKETTKFMPPTVSTMMHGTFPDASETKSIFCEMIKFYKSMLYCDLHDLPQTLYFLALCELLKPCNEKLLYEGAEHYKLIGDLLSFILPSETTLAAPGSLVLLGVSDQEVASQ